MKTVHIKKNSGGGDDGIDKCGRGKIKRKKSKDTIKNK